jgi:hypothetical protein
MKNNLDQKLYAVKEHVSNSLEAHEKTIFDIE